MPTSVQCPTCLNTLSVEDSLRGKTTACPRCGDQVSVPETFAIAEESPDPKRPPLEELADTPGEACPLCGTTVPPDALLCPACSFDCRTAAPPEQEIPSDPTYVTYRPHRGLFAQLRSAFSTFDGFVSVLVFFVLLAACITWCVHIGSQPGGFYFRNLFPALFMIAAVFLFIAPLAALAVKIASAFLHRDPPEALYRRTATVLTLPLALDLFSTGGPPVTQLDTRWVIPAWVISLALFAYLFRAPLQKILTTLLAFMVALVVAWSLLMTAATTFPSFGESLYKDMSPPGLFEQFAAGHSPPPETPATQPLVLSGPTTMPKEIQELAKSMDPDPSPLEPEPETPPQTQTQATAPVTPAPQPPVAIHPSQPAVLILPPHPVAPPKPPANPAPPAIAIGAIPIKIITHPDLQSVRSLIVGAENSNYMLIIKSGDSEAIAQRWKIDPLHNDGEVRFSELPKQPNDYALSPSGAALVTLSHFPHNQLQITTFQNNQPFTRKILLDREDLRTNPALVGFIDPTRFLVHWTDSGLLQLWTTDGVMAAATRTQAITDNLSQWAINPNPLRTGPGLAVVMTGSDGLEQLVVCRIQGWQLLRRISPMNRSFTTVGLAYSPDGSSVALCSSTSDGASILAFDLATGDNTVSATFSADLLNANPLMQHHHGLLWLQNQFLLAGGNELFDAGTGKHLGSLGLTNIEDAYNAGSDSVLFLQSTPTGAHRVFVAKINPAGAKSTDALQNH